MHSGDDVSMKEGLNLNIRCYLLRVIRGCGLVEWNRSHRDRKLAQGTTSFVCPANANGGLVIDDEVTNKQTSRR